MLILNNNILDNETLKLSEETTSASDGIISIVRSYLKRIRLNFARKSESSVMSNVLSNLYLRTLTGKIRYAAVFLLTFSIVSLIICYIANASIGGFISDIDSFSAVVLMAVSLLFFTTNKSFYSLIISSKFLSSLSIVYSDSSLFKEDDDDANLRNASTYSTPFFLGIICGIFTVIYPVGIICLFLVSIILVLLVFNRPESGLLLTIVLLPFLDRSFLIIFLCITFTSLLYKYLQAKRHISFNAPSLIIIITFVYVTVRFLSSDNNLFFSEYISYLVFFITCLVTLNVIRSTAMFRRVVLVLLRMSRLFAAMLIIFYLCNIFFGSVKVSEFMNLLGADSISHSLTSETFIAPFIVMALPLNFSHLVGISKKNGIANNLLFVTMILACIVYVPDFSLILICVLSCVAILTIFDRKYGFLILISPFAA